MDFFNQEVRAQKQTRRLILLFGLAVVAVVFFVYVILATFIEPFLKPTTHISSVYGFFNDFLVEVLPQIGDAFVRPFRFLKWIWDPRLFIWIASGTLLSIALGCIYKFRLLSGGGSSVAELLGGRKIEINPSDSLERQLRNVVAEMAVASGLSVPDIYVLDRERGINSFAAGHSREDVAIGVTFGCLKLLTRDELQGIVAHEFSHVLNGDTQLNMKLMALAHGLFWPTIVGRILVRGSTQAPAIGESIFDEDTDPNFMPTAPVGFLFLLIGGISSPFVRLIKSLICREREWLADATAVQFTRNPAGIGGALKKIGGLYKAGRLDSPCAETASHLYFASSTYDPWFNFLSTHPPLAKRILAIDPTFDGQFLHINSLPRQTDDTSPEARYDHLYEESLRRARAEAKARAELE
jgi:Zn-dependent protease with chaperone function